MSGAEMDGFDELKDKLNQIQKNAEELEGENQVSFPELFNPSFMKKYTDFNNIEEMFQESEFECGSNEEFEEIPEAELDSFVRGNTVFESWEEMKGKAGKDWAADQLGF